MKKYFYSVLAAGMLFATSCSQDELVESPRNEGQQMTFKVEVPGVAQSRAIADGIEVGAGKYADKLVYAMYEEDQNDILVAGFASDDDKDGTFVVNVPMAKDIKYDILFLAYNEANSAFVIDNSDAKSNNLKALQMKSSLSANQEAYDAFIGRVDSKGVDAAATTTVTLKRPFAQVNAATTAADLTTANILKAEVTSSKFVIYNAPNTLNVFTGEVSGSTTFTYDQADILKKFGQTEYPYNEVIAVDNTNYYYLAMAYVLAGAESSTHDADFSFYRADDKLVSSLSVLSLPIQANFRTNVLGTLLTQEENYEIKIDAVFGEPAHAPEEGQTEKIVVATAEDLKAAIANAVTSGGESRAIGHDIKYTLIELQPGTYTGAFNIDGKNVILMSNDKENTIINGLVHGLNWSHVVLRNLTLTNSTPAQSGITNRDDADNYCLGAYVTDFVIENCTFNISATGGINIYANRSDYTTSTIEGVNYDLVIKNTTFNCNGQRPVRGKTNSYVEGCTFNNQHRYAIQVQGNSQLADPETVTFINNKIVNPCQTSNEAFAAAVSISKSQLLENVAFNISGNTIESESFELKNLVYDISDNVKITTCTLNGAPITDFECKAIEGVTDAKEVVFIDGLQKNADGAWVVSNANGLATLNALMADKTAGKNVKVILADNIDFAGKTWTPVDSHSDTAFTFSELDGQNHTISNLTVNGQAMFTRFAGSGNVTIKNVTFDKATVNSTALNTSILTVQSYQNVLLDNVDVKNSSVTGAYKVAPLIATVYNENPNSTVTATLKNCDVENVEVKATSYDFCTAGMVAFVYAADSDNIEFENCTVKNVKLYAPNEYTAHAAIYTTGTDALFNEAEGVTVTNVTFENI